ncbi:TPA: DUF2283 domain-containing protein, partial [Candidatus Bipolaricaulota bacterium]|nr:DUF2283 domain-containing protein [Candidatus Bipolaricaulota bacterium]
MGTNLTFQYDREADILYINTCSPYPEQESEELDDEIIARFNPETDEIENLEVLFFFNYRFLLVCIVRKYKSRQRENSWILTSRCRRQRELWFYD